MEKENQREQWKPIPGYNKYICAQSGEIKNGRTKVLLKQKKQHTGQLMTSIRDENGGTHHELVHILIAKTWVPNPDNKTNVKPINDDWTDCRADNLQWCNVADIPIQQTIKFTRNTTVNKVVHYDEKNKIIKIYKDSVAAGGELNINPDTIRKCCKGMTNPYIYDNNNKKVYFKFLAVSDNINDKIIDPATIPTKKVINKPNLDKSRHIRKINVFDLDKKPLGTYDTMCIAATEYNVSEGTVSNSCHGTTTDHRCKYIFSYAD